MNIVQMMHSVAIINNHQEIRSLNFEKGWFVFYVSIIEGYWMHLLIGFYVNHLESLHSLHRVYFVKLLVQFGSSFKV